MREEASAVPAIVCWNCGASLQEIPRPISRHANCPKCFEDLHCCRLCRHYAPGVTGQCEEERADPPVHKETANFCDFFRPAAGVYRAVRGERRDVAKARLDALFGASAEQVPSGGSSPTAGTSAQSDAARARLDALFRGEDDP